MANVESDQLKNFFLQLAEYGEITTAARMAGIDREVILHLRDTDEEFKTGYDLAMESHLDILYAKMLEGARYGFKKTVVDKDGVERTVRTEPSVKLLQFLTESFNPHIAKNKDMGNNSGVTVVLNTQNQELGKNKRAAKPDNRRV